jgi:hypothetical protein
LARQGFMNTSFSTTGLFPLVIGSSEVFICDAFANQLPWSAIAGGTVNLLLSDPNGVQYTVPATIVGATPSANWTIIGPVGQWGRGWSITDSNGVTQVSATEAFEVQTSP